MSERIYKLYIREEIIAESLSIETALILIKALFSEYYNEEKMEITIREMERSKNDA